MDEMMALAGEWGVELPDDALDAVAGGCSGCPFHEPTDEECPFYCPF